MAVSDKSKAIFTFFSSMYNTGMSKKDLVSNINFDAESQGISFDNALKISDMSSKVFDALRKDGREKVGPKDVHQLFTLAHKGILDKRKLKEPS